MTRFFVLLALLTGTVAIGCSEDPQARYANEELGDESGEATPPADELIDDAAMDNYAEQQSQIAE